MKIKLTINLGDDARRAISHYFVRPGKATRAEAMAWATGLIEATLRDMRDEYDRDPDVRRRRARKLNHLGPGLGMNRPGRIEWGNSNGAN